MVATPIGNLQDFSNRARKTLEQVDWIACEDTRHSAKLLRHYEIDTPTISYHEHNEQQRTEQLIERLQEGQDGALISDAGTPLISDPGYHLVRRCREMRLPVTAVPGPSAALAALSISGLPNNRFLFAGFPPRKEGEARRFFEELKPVSATLIFYLAPHRLARNLDLALEILGLRPAFLVRELTKLHEEIRWGTLADLPGQAVRGENRGEYTLVVGGAAESESERSLDIDVTAYLQGLRSLRGYERKEALRIVSEQLGIPRNRLYRVLLKEKEDSPPEGD